MGKEDEINMWRGEMRLLDLLKIFAGTNKRPTILVRPYKYSEYFVGSYVGFLEIQKGTSMMTYSYVHFI